MAAVPRAAATVVLLRDGRGGLEAYLQRRPMGMGFAGGLWVFPGGRVERAYRRAYVEQSARDEERRRVAQVVGVGLERQAPHDDDGVADERRRDSTHDTVVVLVDGKKLPSLWKNSVGINGAIEAATLEAMIGE